MSSETDWRTGTWFFRLAVTCCAGLLAAPAWAASMQKVDQSTWQGGVTGLPTYVNMYIYVPDTPAAKPPIVVVPHHCSGSASTTNTEITTLYRVADKTGFIVIIPEATGQNCWDAGSARSLKHGGTGDTGAVVQMVKYVLSKYQGDGSRVYTVGGSSGGIMTEALLGVYPDVFMAGVSLMGVPCGCWAEQYNDVVGKPSSGTGQWSGPCAGGTVTKTAQQWGDLVRSYFPGYSGHRPRLQHWHGTADTTLNYKVMAEDIKEWTNVLGLSTTPTATDTPMSGTTHQSWKNSCGFTVYETFSMSGVAHAVPFDGAAIATYFGLDQAGGQDPETAACPGAIPGGSGNGGSSGSGSGAAGSSGSGGSGGGGRPGGPPDGGADASDGASSPDAAEGSGGHSGSGSANGNGGSGGATASGGNSGTGGLPQATGGSSASGGTTGSGGAMGSGGSGPSNGGSASGGHTGSGMQSGGSSSSGCAYAGRSGERDSSAPLFVMTAVLGLAVRPLRRRARP